MIKINLHNKIFQKISWQEIVLIILIIAFLSPTLFVSWMILDDGASILMAQKIGHFLSAGDFRGLFDLFIEKESGRFRPAYWLFFWFSSLIVGTNALGHHLIHFLIVSATVYLLFATVKKISGSKTAALLSGFLFLITSLNTENWYRLGPQEPFITFYLALSTFSFLELSLPMKSLKSRKIWYVLMVFPLILAYFTKETFMAILPLAVLFVIGTLCIKEDEKKKSWLKNSLIFLGVNLIILAIAVPIIIYGKSLGSYTANYTVSPQTLLGNGNSYIKSVLASYGVIAWILTLSFISFSIRDFLKSKSSFIEYLQIFFLIGALSFLIFQLPWAYVMGRYLEPTLFLLFVFFGLEISRILKFVELLPNLVANIEVWDKRGVLRLQSKQIVWAGIILLSVVFVYNNITPHLNYALDSITGTQNLAKTYQLIAQQAPKEGRVFLNLKEGDATIELVFESGLHLNLFHNRPDLNVSYLNSGSINNIKAGDLIVTAFAGDSYTAFNEGQLRRDNRLKLWQTINHNIANITLPPFSYKSLLRYVLFHSSFKVQNEIQYTTTQSLWKIYKVI